METQSFRGIDSKKEQDKRYQGIMVQLQWQADQKMKWRNHLGHKKQQLCIGLLN